MGCVDLAKGLTNALYRNVDSTNLDTGSTLGPADTQQHCFDACKLLIDGYSASGDGTLKANACCEFELIYMEDIAPITRCTMMYQGDSAAKLFQPALVFKNEINKVFWGWEW